MAEPIVCTLLITRHCFYELDSTNNWCLAHTHYPLPLVCRCHYQTHGKGRRTNQWRSLDGDLLFSYSTNLHTDLGTNLGKSLSTGTSLTGIPPQLSLHIAATLTNHINHFIDSNTDSLINPLDTQKSAVLFKWPNDIYLLPMGSLTWQKIGGVLIESIHSMMQTQLVIGVGLNLNPNHPAHLMQTLKKNCQHQLTEWLFEKLLAGIEQSVKEVTELRLPLDLKRLNELHYLHRKWIVFDSDEVLVPEFNAIPSNFSQRYRAFVTGIDQQGRLLLTNHGVSCALTQGFNLQMTQQPELGE